MLVVEIVKTNTIFFSQEYLVFLFGYDVIQLGGCVSKILLHFQLHNHRLAFEQLIFPEPTDL